MTTITDVELNFTYYFITLKSKLILKCQTLNTVFSTKFMVQCEEQIQLY